MGRFRALHDLSRDESDDTNRRRAGRFLIESLRNSEGEIFDLSQTGARFRTRHRWAVGDVRAVTFEYQTEDTAMHFEVRCVWVRKISWFSRLVGVEFINLSAEDKKKLSTLATRSAKLAWGLRRQANDVSWDQLGALEHAHGAAASGDESAEKDAA